MYLKLQQKLEMKEKLMKTVTYSIPNISCGHCVHTIQSEVGELAGVQSVVADQNQRIATIMFDMPATEEQIKKLLAEIDYPVAN
jgi:copper chaperone